MSTGTAPTPSTGSPASTPATQPKSHSVTASAPPFVDLSQAIRSAPGTPTWEMARFYPAQGDWAEEQYLELSDNMGIEFADGQLDFLPMPSKQHHRVMQYLYRLLHEFVAQRRLGEVFVMDYPVRTMTSRLREPDVLFVTTAQETSDSFAGGCDLAMEVVFPGGDNRDRDLVKKRVEYAAAGIPEYWIVDPQTQTVLTLPDGSSEYAVPGEFNPGEMATSELLDGFAVEVTACFAVAEQAD